MTAGYEKQNENSKSTEYRGIESNYAKYHSTENNSTSNYNKYQSTVYSVTETEMTNTGRIKKNMYERLEKQ